MTRAEAHKHMELVPFNPQWADSGTKLDLKALYRRPSEDGKPTIMPLPVRRHNDWARKGFTYVTLATAEDVIAVRGSLRAVGVNLDALAKCYDSVGNFKMRDFLAEIGEDDAAKLADLQAKVDKFGAEAVTEMMRVNEPGFVMPKGIKKVKKGDAA